MNYFTKEELIELLSCCKAAYLSGYINPRIPINLDIKLKSMIDHLQKQENCEHDWEFEFNDYHCLKCGLRKRMILR